jgi:hypothetical protein
MFTGFGTVFSSIIFGPDSGDRGGDRKQDDFEILNAGEPLFQFIHQQSGVLNREKQSDKNFVIGQLIFPQVGDVMPHDFMIESLPVSSRYVDLSKPHEHFLIVSGESALCIHTL